MNAMKFDFDELVDRTGTGSIKWSAPEYLPPNTPRKPLPMWVADMDFRSPQPVIEALKRAVEHGVFGYDKATPGFFEAVVQWQLTRHKWQVKPQWIVLTPGVVPALLLIIQTFSRPGDSILMQMPVYRPFHYGAQINGRRVIGVPLEHDGKSYRFDPERFRKAITPDTKLFILSNPHNPVGKVWSEEELRTMGDICIEKGVLVISDEIHQDFVLNPALRHIPFASLGEKYADNSIVCTSPSKTFNLAGLRLSFAFVANDRVRQELQRALERTGLHPNTFGYIACEAAYRYGAPWLDSLLDYIRGNHAFLANKLQLEIPEITAAPADSLYLAWLDCRGLKMGARELNDFMLRDAGLRMNPGDEFGPEGAGYMRMNLGCPRALLDKALCQLQQAVENWRKGKPGQ
jgi:cystathionine beta-lyase